MLKSLEKSDGNLPDKIIIISDCADSHEYSFDVNCVSLDKTKIEEAEILRSTLSKFVDDVEVISKLEQLIDLPNKDNTLIYPYKNGSQSRNRDSIVQAFCEGMKINYVGADAFARFLCADKALSKSVIRKSRLKPTNHVRIDSIADLDNNIKEIERLGLPLFVKPNNEASSIGITERNICSNLADALALAKETLVIFKGSVLIEPFISGKEVNVCMYKDIKDQLNISYVERQVVGEPKYFESNPFTGPMKRLKTKKTKFLNCRNSLLESMEDKFIDLYHRVGSLAMLRLDGRLTKDSYTILELTSSPNLNHSAEYLSSFQLEGLSPETVLKEVILSEWNSIKYRGNKCVE